MALPMHATFWVDAMPDIRILERFSFDVRLAVYWEHSVLQQDHLRDVRADWISPLLASPHDDNPDRARIGLPVHRIVVPLGGLATAHAGGGFASCLLDSLHGDDDGYIYSSNLPTLQPLGRNSRPRQTSYAYTNDPAAGGSLCSAHAALALVRLHPTPVVYGRSTKSGLRRAAAQLEQGQELRLLAAQSVHTQGIENWKAQPHPSSLLTGRKGLSAPYLLDQESWGVLAVVVGYDGRGNEPPRIRSQSILRRSGRYFGSGL